MYNIGWSIFLFSFFFCRVFDASVETKRIEAEMYWRDGHKEMQMEFGALGQGRPWTSQCRFLERQ